MFLVGKLELNVYVLYWSTFYRLFIYQMSFRIQQQKQKPKKKKKTQQPAIIARTTNSLSLEKTLCALRKTHKFHTDCEWRETTV